jgi:hypothetical protein
VNAALTWTRGWLGREAGLDAALTWTRGWLGREAGLDARLAWTRGWLGREGGSFCRREGHSSLDAGVAVFVDARVTLH